VTRAALDPHVVRYLLDRSSDEAAPAESSQDYLVIQSTPGALCFAVTDGVGSSFRGELAAQLLATRLVDMLTKLPAVPAESRMADELTRGLHDLTAEVRDKIRRMPIPAGVSGVVQSVLAEQREYGSEAMFVCGRIDVQDGRSTRVGVAWLGDCYLRVVTGSRDRPLTGATADRWSSDRGPRGQVRAWTGDAPDVRRIIGCTDGLLPELDSVIRLPDDDLDDRLAALSRRPDSDDIALVDIALRDDAMPPPRGEWRPAEPASEPERNGVADPGAVVRDRAPAGPETAGPGAPAWLPGTARGLLRWSAVPGADEYTVEFDADPDFGDPISYRVSRTTFTAPPMDARTWARVRGLARGRDGQWSELVELGRQPAPGSRHGGPAVRCTRLDARSGQISLEWDRLPGRDFYVLRLERPAEPDRVRHIRVSGRSATLSLSPAHYRISVRGDRPEDAEDWGDQIDVRLNH
jgi:hypothetical protein